jgi:hypothetical protein
LGTVQRRWRHPTQPPGIGPVWGAHDDQASESALNVETVLPNALTESPIIVAPLPHDQPGRRQRACAAPRAAHAPAAVTALRPREPAATTAAQRVPRPDRPITSRIGTASIRTADPSCSRAGSPPLPTSPPGRVQPLALSDLFPLGEEVTVQIRSRPVNRRRTKNPCSLTPTHSFTTRSLPHDLTEPWTARSSTPTHQRRSRQGWQPGPGSHPPEDQDRVGRDQPTRSLTCSPPARPSQPDAPVR